MESTELDRQLLHTGNDGPWQTSSLHLDDGGSIVLRNVRILPHYYTVSQAQKTTIWKRSKSYVNIKVSYQVN